MRFNLESIERTSDDHWTRRWGNQAGNIAMIFMILGLFSALVFLVTGNAVFVIAMYSFTALTLGLLIIGIMLERAYKKFADKRNRDRVANFAKKVRK